MSNDELNRMAPDDGVWVCGTCGKTAVALSSPAIELRMRNSMQDNKRALDTIESVITEKMWLAGLAEARRAGLGPAFTCCDYRELKAWLSAAYRAMRLAECEDEK